VIINNVGPYDLLFTTVHFPELQLVAPVHEEPPHWPYKGAPVPPLLDEVVVVVAVEVLVEDGVVLAAAVAAGVVVGELAELPQVNGRGPGTV
jgi:hypothetical protein